MTLFKVSKFPPPHPFAVPPPHRGYPPGITTTGHQGQVITGALIAWGVVMGRCGWRWSCHGGGGLPGDVMGRARSVFGVGGGPG